MMDLNEKFPDMQPVSKPPSLFTVNGIGLTLYGARALDPDTGTYVKTQCLCVLFIPLLALKAFRVADAAGGGWYFLGRVPLSGLARGWNWLVVLTVAAVAGNAWWLEHTGTPEYKAGRALARAEGLAGQGQVLEAARQLRDVARNDQAPRHAATARDRLRDLLDAPVPPATLTDVAGVFQVYLETVQPPGVPDLYERARKRAEEGGDADPRGAATLVESVAALAPNPEEPAALVQKLLERVVAQDPDDLETVSKLAGAYETQKKMDPCEALLKPHADRLGTTEGARILGQLYARRGEYDKACALLQPYTSGRLQQLHAAEKAFTDAVQATRQRALEAVQNGQAPQFDVARYQRAGDAEKQVMVREYLEGEYRKVPAIREAQEAVARQTGVVPVALDLGIAILHRGQALADPAARRAELEKAEKTFLDVRGAAGESDAYRLYLGQVYYWLGKQDEGRKLFDDLLTSRQRQPEALVQVSQLLRELGAVAESRALMEEAFAKETRPEIKQGIATLRAVTPVDLEDQITWLRRADPADPQTKAQLSSALGNRALQEGKEEEAAGHLRDSLAAYARMPESVASLNNAALVHQSLFHLTGERASLDQAARMFEKALKQMPANVIVLLNTAASVEASALADLLSPSMDLALLKQTASLDLLPYLYSDQAGRDLYAQRVRGHPGLARARAYLERGLVLAPKRPAVYESLSSLYEYVRDRAALEDLKRRLDPVELDLTDALQNQRDYLSGKKDEKYRAEAAARARRAEAIVNRARPKKGVTFAVAATTLVRERLTLRELGQPVDLDALVALAGEAHAAAPSKATLGYVQTTLLTRAAGALAGQDQVFADMKKRCERALGSSSLLVAVALAREGPARAAALANPDVKRTLALLREDLHNFPDSHEEWAWAVLQAADPAEARRLAEAIRKDESRPTEIATRLRLAPASAAAALQAYWNAQVLGKEEQGLRALKDCGALGVQLPFDPAGS